LPLTVEEYRIAQLYMIAVIIAINPQLIASTRFARKENDLIPIY